VLQSSRIRIGRTEGEGIEMEEGRVSVRELMEGEDSKEV